MNEYLKAMQALPKLRMNADRMLAAAPAPEAEQWWDGYRQALHDMAVELPACQGELSPLVHSKSA